jgi:hypothetical protein
VHCCWRRTVGEGAYLAASADTQKGVGPGQENGSAHTLTWNSGFLPTPHYNDRSASVQAMTTAASAPVPANR